MSEELAERVIEALTHINLCERDMKLPVFAGNRKERRAAESSAIWKSITPAMFDGFCPEMKGQTVPDFMRWRTKDLVRRSPDTPIAIFMGGSEGVLFCVAKENKRPVFSNTASWILYKWAAFATGRAQALPIIVETDLNGLWRTREGGERLVRLEELTPDELNHVTWLFALSGADESRNSQWSVLLNDGYGPRARFLTDPLGAREAFRLRDIPEGKARRAALRHWVSEHWRKKGRDSEADRTWVREHLRGAEDFTWNGLRCRIEPSGEDLRRAGAT